MDYFYVGNHGGSVGLQDLFLKLKLTPEKFMLGVDAHFFSAAADVLDVDKFTNTGEYTAMSSGLGTEIDVYGGFKLAKGVAFKAGYSQMMGSATMEAIKGGSSDESSNWGWAMIIVKPSFIGGK